MATAEILGVVPFGSGNSFRAYSAARPASPLRAIEREMEHSTLTSQYIRRLQMIENLVDQTKKLRILSENWDSYGAMPPNDSAITAATRFLFSCSGADVLPVRVLPSAEGGIALRFATKCNRALVEFLNTGSIEVMLYDDKGSISPAPEQLIEVNVIAGAVQAHLMR